MNYSETHLRETADIVSKLDPALCEKAEIGRAHV